MKIREIVAIPFRFALQLLHCVSIDFFLNFRQFMNCYVYLFLQDVGESLDPRLESVLQCRTSMRGDQHLMKINEAEVEYNSNFQLFLATPLSNPQFFPEVFNQVTVINFTVTFEGQLVVWLVDW